MVEASYGLMRSGSNLYGKLYLSFQARLVLRISCVQEGRNECNDVFIVRSMKFREPQS